jgi:hypothetical protein
MPTNPQSSRKHHFIPAFYTARWATNKGQLIQWSKPYRDLRSLPKHPNATGFDYDLYSFKGLAPELRQWFEDNFLREVDDLASKAIEQILMGRIA